MKNGNSASATISRIGQRRQVVIPKQVFDSLKLREGDFVEVSVERGRLQMRPKRLVDLDDTLTPSEAAKVRVGKAEVKAGLTRPWRTVKNELGY